MNWCNRCRAYHFTYLSGEAPCFPEWDVKIVEDDDIETASVVARDPEQAAERFFEEMDSDGYNLDESYLVRVTNPKTKEYVDLVVVPEATVTFHVWNA